MQTYGGCLSFFEEYEEDVERLYEQLEKIKETTLQQQNENPRDTVDDEVSQGENDGIENDDDDENNEDEEEEETELDKLPKSDVERLKKESHRKSLQLFKSQFKMNTHKKHKAYVTKSIAIISHYPFYRLFKTYLMHLYRQHLTPSKLPIERYICNFVDEIPLPPKGIIELQYELPPNTITLKRPPPNELPMVDYDFDVIWQCLSIEKVIKCCHTMLTEKSLLLFSSSLSKLNVVCSTLRDLIFPFKWHHVYIPILPIKCLEFLNAPMPFVMGTHTTFLPDDIPDHIVLVDLDNNTVNDQGNLTTPLPERETTKLTVGLHKLGIDEAIKFSCKPPSDSAFTMAPPPMEFESNDGNHVSFEVVQPKIRELFLRFFTSLFKRYRSFLLLEKRDITIDNFEPMDIFDSKGFIADSQVDARPFLNVFLQSQSFTQFLFERTLMGDEDEIRFFDESIAAKLNRSRLRIYKHNTSFLNSKEWQHNNIKVALTPNDADFSTNNDTFCYNNFPNRLNEAHFISPRYVKPLVAESSVKLEMATRVFTSWSIVLNVLTNLEDQLKLFQKRNTIKLLQTSHRKEDFKFAINRSKTNLRANHSRSMSLTDYTFSEYEVALNSSKTHDTNNDSSIMNLGGAPLLLNDKVPLVHPHSPKLPLKTNSIEEVLSRISFSLEASCFKCGHVMTTSRDIRYGWTHSMQEYRTHCSSCTEFVMPYLLVRFDISPSMNEEPDHVRQHVRSVSMPASIHSNDPNALQHIHIDRYYYLSPFVIRKEVHNLMKKDVFCDDDLLENRSYVFW
eukprot:CAMPEP_0117418888 /NCGR_PEP_ID=MMETSP0758-20121206/575_1 /TAXON_ID=63605 /ORGANISM="Percolomonas cosmopolitus, Strain AE-1 (ATCC 50343)" /LENGTH=787 /DNA_ID=CAMNT_0005199653 /DNA_START=224 /DNA_END=2584 /DNA_ORIENTATION=+